MMKFLTLTVSVMVLTSCLSSCVRTEVVYTNACPEGDTVCQRNQNAKTLAELGQTEAATQLMCSDPDMLGLLGDACISW